MKDLFGKALLDFHRNEFTPPLLLHNEYGEPEDISPLHYFKTPEEYSELELFALSEARGKILDVGAAAGRHALYLQNLGHDVTAMDISPACIELMKLSGVNKPLCENIFEYRDSKFDTITMLMNGVGLVGDNDGLERLLNHMHNILNPEGQLLVDSSDIQYLYEGQSLPSEKYYGELTFHYEYQGDEDEPFKWLYIDPKSLISIATKQGWNCQIMYEDETSAFLARLNPMN